jgi:hypothetical protein
MGGAGEKKGIFFKRIPPPSPGNFPKILSFGETVPDRGKKAGFRSFFQESFLKPVGFWQRVPISWLVCFPPRIIFFIT